MNTRYIHICFPQLHVHKGMHTVVCVANSVLAQSPVSATLFPLEWCFAVVPSWHGRTSASLQFSLSPSHPIKHGCYCTWHFVVILAALGNIDRLLFWALIKKEEPIIFLFIFQSWFIIPSLLLPRLQQKWFLFWDKNTPKYSSGILHKAQDHVFFFFFLFK